MKAKHKKWVFWSSLGGLVLGGAMLATRRAGKRREPPIDCRRIPQECRAVILWTELFEVENSGASQWVHDRYLVQPTAFHVWSVLDLAPSTLPGRSGQGTPIYHISRWRTQASGSAGPDPDDEQPLERFYGVVTAVDLSGSSCGNNTISRGGMLEIRKCLVGGAANGVESGEIHRSAARILNYRIV